MKVYDIYEKYKNINSYKPVLMSMVLSWCGHEETFFMAVKAIFIRHISGHEGIEKGYLEIAYTDLVCTTLSDHEYRDTNGYIYIDDHKRFHTIHGYTIDYI